MSALELINAWSTLSTNEIATRLAAGQDVAAAEQLFGPQATAELVWHAASGGAPAGGTRGESGGREAVVLTPGMMGSLLTSIRGLTTLLWLNPALLLRGEANLLELDDAGKADRYPEVEAVPFSLDKLCYLKAALVLRRETDLYEFPYDWRRPIAYNAGMLARCLERWAAGTNRRFTLVGHSMGGLVIRTYLAQHGRAAAKRVRRAISLGTPYHGTVEAVQNFVLGNTLMNIAEQLNPANRVDELVLGLPSVYELLPAPPELFPSGVDYPVNWDLYAAEEWRRPGIRGDYLQAGAAFHRMLAAADPQVETVQVAGCNVATTVAIERSFTADEQPVFTTVRREDGPDSGDSTVPLWSAMTAKIRTYYVEEQHRYLPANAEVQRAVLDLVYGGAPSLATAVPEKHGFWSLRDVEPAGAEASAEELRGRLATGNATEADLAQLYFVR